MTSLETINPAPLSSPAPHPAPPRHQFVDRQTGAVIDEAFFADNIVRFLYGSARERAPWLLRLLTSARFSRWLAALNFDLPLAPRLIGNRRFLERCGVDPLECLLPPALLNTPRAIFERQLRYWECRPMPDDPAVVVSPCDARVLIGSQSEASSVCLKGKLFAWDELVGRQQTRWHAAFSGGDAAVFRLTPDRYHWNHTPVSGVVEAICELDGSFHSSHPMALIAEATPLSKNRRTVTIIDTDVAGGTRVGLVAMVEVVALMIGDLVQRYSVERYADPRPLMPGMFVRKGAPKSVFRPGSSTTVLLFQPGRVRFDADLMAHARRTDALSDYSLAFGRRCIEVDVRVRSPIAMRA